MIKSDDYSYIKEKIINRINYNDSIFPDTILIDNVSFCNLECFMCPHKEMKREKGKMDINLYKKIIDEIAEKKPNARVWITFFGEGLILKELPERIKYAKEKGLTDVVFNSNGNLLNYDISKKLITAGLDAIYVGIDAFNEETYSKIRVKGNLNNVVEGVLSYKRALNEYGNKNQKIYVQFVEMKENVDEVQQFIEFWTNNNIMVKVRPKISWAGKVRAENLQDFQNRLPCNWAMNTINIADDGRVCLCAVDLECQECMGNVKTNSIEEIWNNQLKNFRKMHLESRWSDLPSLCYRCKDWQSSYAEYVNANK